MNDFVDFSGLGQRFFSTIRPRRTISVLRIELCFSMKSFWLQSRKNTNNTAAAATDNGQTFRKVKPLFHTCPFSVTTEYREVHLVMHGLYFDNCHLFFLEITHYGIYIYMHVSATLASAAAFQQYL